MVGSGLQKEQETRISMPDLRQAESLAALPPCRHCARMKCGKQCKNEGIGHEIANRQEQDWTQSECACRWIIHGQVGQVLANQF